MTTETEYRQRYRAKKLAENPNYDHEVYIKYRANHADRIRKLHREGYVKDHDRRLEGHRKWKAEHYDKVYLADKTWNENNRHKKRAQMIAARIIPLKPVCEICGGTDDLTRHHKDYGKPLEVLTLCKPCHRALEVAEPSVYTIQPEIRFYRGGEPVEILDHSDDSHRGQKWPCRILSTGEVKNILVGSLYYMPIKMKRRHPTVSKCPNYAGALQCKAKGKCPYAYNASITKCSDSPLNSKKETGSKP